MAGAAGGGRKVPVGHLDSGSGVPPARAQAVLAPRLTFRSWKPLPPTLLAGAHRNACKYRVHLFRPLWPAPRSAVFCSRRQPARPLL